MPGIHSRHALFEEATLPKADVRPPAAEGLLNAVVGGPLAEHQDHPGPTSVVRSPLPRPKLGLEQLAILFAESNRILRLHEA